jgi:hypothetical protein
MKIEKDSVPKTILEAVDNLVAAISDDEKAFIRGSKDPYSEVHFSAGMYIRNNWSLWEKDTPLVQDAIKTYKIAHGDDISGLIFEWAFAKIRGVEFDPFVLVKKYEEHWQKFTGKNALEAGGVQSI